MAYWAAAQLQPQRDGLALQCLRQAGFETYAPRLREHRTVHGRKVVADARCCSSIMSSPGRTAVAYGAMGAGRGSRRSERRRHPLPSPTESLRTQGARDRRPDRSAQATKFRAGERLRVTSRPVRRGPLVCAPA